MAELERRFLALDHKRNDEWHVYCGSRADDDHEAFFQTTELWKQALAAWQEARDGS